MDMGEDNSMADMENIVDEIGGQKIKHTTTSATEQLDKLISETKQMLDVDTQTEQEEEKVEELKKEIESIGVNTEAWQLEPIPDPNSERLEALEETLSTLQQTSLERPEALILCHESSQTDFEIIDPEEQRSLSLQAETVSGQLKVEQDKVELLTEKLKFLKSEFEDQQSEFQTTQEENDRLVDMIASVKVQLENEEEKGK